MTEMEQHITAKHLNELSEKGKEKLRKRMYHGDRWEQGDKFIDEKGIEQIHGDGENNWVHYGNLPLFSIGQMIQYLEENTKFLKIYQIRAETNKDGYTWSVSDTHHRDNGGINTSRVRLIDALWDAVKEILEK